MHDRKGLAKLIPTSSSLLSCGPARRGHVLQLDEFVRGRSQSVKWCRATQDTSVPSMSLFSLSSFFLHPFFRFLTPNFSFTLHSFLMKPALVTFFSVVTLACAADVPITQDELVRRTQELYDAIVPGNQAPWKKYFA